MSAIKSRLVKLESRQPPKPEQAPRAVLNFGAFTDDELEWLIEISDRSEASGMTSTDSLGAMSDADFAELARLYEKGAKI
jgi:hypothetical protein